MKLQKLLSILFVSGSAWVVAINVAIAENAQISSSKIPYLNQVEFFSSSAYQLVQTPSQETVTITAVKANPTDKGVEVILETAQGEKLQVTNRSTGNNFIADISNAQLRLPSGEATFRSEKPNSEITEITVTNIDTNTVRVVVAGEKALPTVELFDDNAGLVFEITSAATATQPPQQPETPQSEEPAAQQDEPIELVVTGEQDNYRIPDASVGTRTDTPLRDIPQSIQVVPQQVLRDRQARSITDGLENVSGVNPISPGLAGSRDNFTIRGFEIYGNSLVNGIPEDILSDSSFVNVERLEVLKGPASVLYGEGGLGGAINFVTKQPLRDPFYEISATIGSFNDYQGTIDLTGPLNDSRTALYRFIAGYRSAETFVDFNEFTKLSIAPSLSLSLSQNTDLVIESDVNRMERNGQQPPGLPAVGTVLPNPNGRVRRSFSSKGPVTDNLTIAGRVGYRLEHRFNENWKLRNAFRYRFYNDDDRGGAPDFNPTSLAADNRTLNRRAIIGSQFYDYYYLDTNLLGKFNTGSINHQLLFGFSLSRNTTDLRFEFGIPAAPVDIFNPVYDQRVVPTGIPNSSRFITRDTLGIYLQDQITLAENLKLLLGGRVDFFEERTTNRLTNVETNQSDTAFSPRVGIVYQPIQPISLYASFARSFTPTIGTSATGEAFQPERGTQYEVGIKADLTSKLSTTLAFYDLTRSNVTTTDPNNPDFSVQTGEQNSRGIELDISGEILPGWNIIAGYAYTDARVTKDNNIPVGNRLFAAPEHSFNLWTTYRIQKGDLQGLGFGLGFYYFGERAADLANTLELPSYFRTDAAIFYEREQFRAAVNFRNLFDVEYYTSRFGSGTLVAPGEPFTVQGTISWQF
ncbi:TonB-dependent siderophore receptor [Chlorogloeopsis fritschii PCC 9212]|uniref:Ferrichrome-iron receptor n=1 Tax=Chlorogloeopsis fritschii PCC 6912 TaxID=211165 RepID=A0A433N1E7_CHLFR|nr:TonB-dependent siderophore receptor [Chlorogloeopsis fritschii]RUR74835.1 ferrichrome-iron receptor [Chlorogloeopsis fritschii PCC 6912]